MVKQLKTRGVQIYAFAVTLLTLCSCQSQGDNYVSEKENTILFEFANFGRLFSTKEGIISNSVHQTRGINPNIPQKDTTTSTKIAVIIPDTMYKKIYEDYGEINTMGELVELKQNTDAKIFIDSLCENADIELSVCEEKIKEELSPLLSQSCAFLVKRGFSHEEIEQMLLDNDADKYSLITLVMGVSSAECENDTICATRGIGSTSSQDGGSIEFANPNLCSNKYLSCAIQAIGFDFINSGGFSGGKIWRKAAIKTAFKSIAKRALGPVGVAVTIVEFGICLSWHV